MPFEQVNLSALAGRKAAVSFNWMDFAIFTGLRYQATCFASIESGPHAAPATRVVVVVRVTIVVDIVEIEGRRRDRRPLKNGAEKI